MRINSPESYYAYQVEIAQEWRAKHNLPKVADATAVILYYTMPDKPIQINRRRMNSAEHMTRLLRVWNLWKQQPKRRK